MAKNNQYHYNNYNIQQSAELKEHSKSIGGVVTVVVVAVAGVNNHHHHLKKQQ